jgi:hypothetical protein
VDNTLNEIRRRISILRSQMLVTEDVIRKQIDRDEDCTHASLRLMAMRTKMLGLIAARDSLGGSERLLSVEERLKAEHPVAKQSKATGRSSRRAA